MTKTCQPTWPSNVTELYIARCIVTELKASLSCRTSSSSLSLMSSSSSTSRMRRPTLQRQCQLFWVTSCPLPTVTDPPPSPFLLPWITWQSLPALVHMTPRSENPPWLCYILYHLQNQFPVVILEQKFPPAFATSPAFGSPDIQVLPTLVQKAPESNIPSFTFLPSVP